ncbi:MAG: hypothetical protein EU530_08295 [Promethearchaeota archaeon]|nr:MAG: hypothetical protein EU530_08295 [Candidatus Lokiarchaeota archaeon]
MTESVKEELIKFIKTLPDDVSIEDVMYHLYIRETILKRAEDIKNNKAKLISQKDAEDQIEKWLN